MAAAVTVIGMVIMLTRRGALRRVTHVTSAMDVVVFVLLSQPDVSLMAGVPLMFQPHVLASTALFSIWPYTRLLLLLVALGSSVRRQSAKRVLLVHR